MIKLIQSNNLDDLEDRIRLDEFYNLFNAEYDLMYERNTSADIISEDFRITTWSFEKRPIKRYEKQFTINLPPF